jgi:hypothetical protein
MKKALIPVVISAALLALPLWIGHAFENKTSDIVVPIVISPNVVNLLSQGTWVTVHAEIPYSTVDVQTATVTLDGIEAVSTFADDRGDLVAKFDLDTVKSKLLPGTATLVLSGMTKEGKSFSGTDSIKVIKVKG